MRSQKDTATIARTCREVAEQLLAIARCVEDGKEVGDDSYYTDTYGLEAYGAITELLLTDNAIKKDQ